MKTSVTLKQNILKSALCLFISAAGMVSNAQSSNEMQPVAADANSAHPAVVTTSSADKTTTNPLTDKLSSFTANSNNNSKVDLRWSTEKENNLSHVMVEKSTDGKNFKDAALVFAYGNTTSRSDYAFADNISKIKSGTVYYRLRTVDVDGTTEYSAACSVKISK